MTHEDRMTRAAAYAAWQRIKKKTEDERDALQAIVNRVIDVLQPIYALLPSKAKALVDEIKAEQKEQRKTNLEVLTRITGNGGAQT